MEDTNRINPIATDRFLNAYLLLQKNKIKPNIVSVTQNIELIDLGFI